MNSRVVSGISFVLVAMGIGACSRTASPQAKPAAESACIQIQQVVPEIVQVDDAGNATEPVRLTIEAHGRAEDLKAGEGIYIEDDREIKAIPVGDLHPGLQTIEIPPGLHMASSSELFEVALVAPDGTETPSQVLPLNSVGYVAPAKPSSAGGRKRKSSTGGGDADQEIATLLPGVDPDEVWSIRQFGPTDVGVTSLDGEIDFTQGDDASQPRQALTVRGVNFKDGLVVRFSTRKGGQRVEATSALTQTKTLATLSIPSGYAPNNPSTLFASVVVVPTKITHAVRSDFGVRSLHGEVRSECK